MNYLLSKQISRHCIAILDDGLSHRHILPINYVVFDKYTTKKNNPIVLSLDFYSYNTTKKT